MQLEHWVSYAATQDPNKAAIHYQGASISYAQFDRLIDRMTWLLRNRYQISAGQRVAHLAFNNPMFLVLVFACARIGAILVPLNFRLALPELQYLLDDCEPSLLIGDREMLTDCLAGNIVPSRCRSVSLTGPQSRRTARRTRDRIKTVC